MTVADEAPPAVEPAPSSPSSSPSWRDADILLPEGSRILHIGPPKTGTTALQSAFHSNRPSLEAQGVHYAGQGRHPMTSVLAGIQHASPWTDNKRPPSRFNWDRLLVDIRGSKASRVVLSSEFFADATPEAIKRVVDELDPDRVQVVVTLRPLAKIMPSQWQQFVQNQLVQGFDSWVDGLLNEPRGKITPVFWRRHRHDELVARWVDVVGPDRVTIVALDDADRDMVLRVFERLTGVREGTLVSEPDLANRSMTVAEIEVIRAFNVQYRAQKLPVPLYSRIMRFGAAQDMRMRPTEPDEAKLELPAWSVEPISNLAREMLASVRATGARIVGDLDALAAVKTSRTPEGDAANAGTTAHVSPEVAASAAMGVLVASGLVRGTGRIEASNENGRDPKGKLLHAPRPVQEPPELMRISTSQLGVVILRRARGALYDRLGGLNPMRYLPGRRR
ncbi:MAG TPA: hypothetical protein VM451_11245 [Candidatus Limnocylindria bacterium]|nr:hypothetical protein [Candidatus Limnocylindria bacterium]